MVDERGSREERAPTPHEILGVARGASKQEIQDAYVALARKFHPDAPGGGNSERMKAINAARDAIIGNAPSRPQSSRPRASPDEPSPPRAEQPRKPEPPREPVEDEKMSWEEMLKRAREITGRARCDAQEFMRFVKNRRDEGCANVDALIQDTRIVADIIERAHYEAMGHGGRINYEIYRGLWEKAGFAPALLDNDPKVLESIFFNFRSNVLFPTMFGNALQSWKRVHPGITDESVLADTAVREGIIKEIRRVKEEDRLDAIRYPHSTLMKNRHFDRLIEQWQKEVGWDISSLA